MTKKNIPPQEAEDLIKEFANKLKKIAPDGEIPDDWWNSILINLGVKDPPGRKVTTEDRDLEMSRDFLNYCLQEEKKGRKLSDSEAFDEWIEKNQDANGCHEKYGISSENRFLERFRKHRIALMSEELGARLDQDLVSKDEAQKARLKSIHPNPIRKP